MTRRPTVSGQFYASDSEELKKQIINCFKGSFGSGMPEHKKNNVILGAIVPHAGYDYSGQCASHIYRAFSESQQPDTFIILGVNHQSDSKGVIISLEDFETPLGIVKNDSDFTNLLVKDSKDMKKIKKLKVNVIHDEEAHAFEHSIEVQLPFLQYIFKDSKKELKIVSIILSDYTYDVCKSLAEVLIDTSKKLKRKICILASSDFTHYGSNYGFVPFTENIRKNLYKMDESAINKILKIDSKSFFDFSKNMTICGAGAITTAIEACKILGAKKSELLKYYTSGDITNDYKTAVGYASIVFS